MSSVILDSTPLGLLCRNKKLKPFLDCRQWLEELKLNGRQIIIPEIADYEIRRELHRLKATGAIRRLDRLITEFDFLTLDSQTLRLAAELWAQARQQGLPTAANTDLDVDVILAAQAMIFGGNSVIATGNMSHLVRFVPAERWDLIVP